MGGEGQPVESKEDADLDPHDARELWKAANPPPTVFVHLNEEITKQFVEGYKMDSSFRERWEKSKVGVLEPWEVESRFFKDEEGLLYFRDADFAARLCVPRSMQARILREY